MTDERRPTPVEVVFDIEQWEAPDLRTPEQRTAFDRFLAMCWAAALEEEKHVGRDRRFIKRQARKAIEAVKNGTWKPPPNIINYYGEIPPRNPMAG